MRGVPDEETTGDSTARIGAIVGGLGYAVLVAAEGIDLLGAPLAHDDAARVVAYYTRNHDLAVFTAVAGTLALFMYGLFVAGVWSWLRRDATPASDPWRALLLVGGIAGLAVAAAGQAAHVVLITTTVDLSAEARALYGFYMSARIIGLGFIALAIIGATTAWFLTRPVPLWAVVPVWVFAAYTLAMTGAAFSTSHAYHRAVIVAFVGHAVWVLGICAWLGLPLLTSDTDTAAMILLRYMFAAVVLAAAVSGVALMVFPGSTPQFFSWGLSPAPIAALIGAFYIAASISFALALRATWTETRAFALGLLGLSVPVFVVTLVHLDIFDFERLQGWLWVILFGAFPLATLWVFFAQRDEPIETGGPVLGSASRVILGVIAVAFFGVAAALFISPPDASDWWPYALPPLGGRVVGGWFVFLGVLAAWSAARGAVREVRLSLIALAAFSVAAMVSALRTFDDLAPASRRALWFVAPLLILLLLVVVASDARRAASTPR